jgi:hypothetical protein
VRRRDGVISSALSFAGSWRGTLVDSRCFGSEERNVNQTDTLTSVDRDQNREIRGEAGKQTIKVDSILLTS